MTDEQIQMLRRINAAYVHGLQIRQSHMQWSFDAALSCYHNCSEAEAFLDGYNGRNASKYDAIAAKIFSEMGDIYD